MGSISDDTPDDARDDARDDSGNVLRAILGDVLGLGADQLAGFTDHTGLFGQLPELDSMAVAGLLTEIEDRFDIVIDDDEVDGELLESFGALRAFIAARRPG